jgi:hypothetical protein
MEFLATSTEPTTHAILAHSLTLTRQSTQRFSLSLRMHWFGQVSLAGLVSRNYLQWFYRWES